MSKKKNKNSMGGLFFLIFIIWIFNPFGSSSENDENKERKEKTESIIKEKKINDKKQKIKNFGCIEQDSSYNYNSFNEKEWVFKIEEGVFVYDNYFSETRKKYIKYKFKEDEKIPKPSYSFSENGKTLNIILEKLNLPPVNSNYIQETRRSGYYDYNYKGFDKIKVKASRFWKSDRDTGGWFCEGIYSLEIYKEEISNK